jgi:hypothetical protein
LAGTIWLNNNVTVIEALAELVYFKFEEMLTCASSFSGRGFSALMTKIVFSQVASLLIALLLGQSDAKRALS